MSEPEIAPPPRATFPTTHWSRVLMAGDRAEPEGRAAMAGLCADYWYPLYVFVRRKGYGPDEAADLVQGTFADLLARAGLGGVEPARGRFRSYLMAACAHHIADRRDRDRAARRGGGRPPIPIDRLEAEGRYGAEPAHRLTAERHFERRWALEMLGRAVGRLEAEMAAAGRSDLFARLLPALTGGRGEASHADVAAGLGMTAGAVKTAASRLRRRYGELLREEVARTVADPAEVDEEVRDLFAALAP